MHNQKSQAAMEFLMTYGWAILIVLIVLAVLFTLGVFNPESGNKCLADQPFGCVDVKITAVAGGDQIKINSGQVSIPNLATSFKSFTGTCTAAGWDNNGNGILNEANDFAANLLNTISLTCPATTVDSPFTGTFIIEYVSGVSGLTHSATVTYNGDHE